VSRFVRARRGYLRERRCRKIKAERKAREWQKTTKLALQDIELERQIGTIFPHLLGREHLDLVISTMKQVILQRASESSLSLSFSNLSIGARRKKWMVDKAV